MVNPTVIPIHSSGQWHLDILTPMQQQELCSISARRRFKGACERLSRLDDVSGEYALQVFINCREEHSTIAAACRPDLSIIKTQFLLEVLHQLLGEGYVVIAGAPRASVALIQFRAAEGAGRLGQREGRANRLVFGSMRYVPTPHLNRTSIIHAKRIDSNHIIPHG
jgi:hypothetical protein